MCVHVGVRVYVYVCAGVFETVCMCVQVTCERICVCTCVSVYLCAV